MTNNDPKVSVVIPVFNTEKYLRRCLNSITSQTYHDIEIIIINDCSPDNAENIIMEFMINDSRIRYLKNDNNLGLGMSRDKGICFSEGKYIMFVDSDDFIQHSAIENCVELIEKYDSDLVEFKFKYYREGDAIDLDQKCCEYRIEYIEVLNKNKDFVLLDKKIDDVYWNKLYKTAIIKKNGLEFRERYFEDTPFTKAYLFNSNKVIIISLVLYYYSVNSLSITRSLNLQKVISAVYGTNKVLEVYNKYNAPKIIKHKFLKSAHKFLIKLILNLTSVERLEICSYIENINKPLRDKMHTVIYLIKNNHNCIFIFICIFILGPKYWLKKLPFIWQLLKNFK